MHPAVIGQFPEQLAGVPNFLGQSHHMWVERFIQGGAEAIETWD